MKLEYASQEAITYACRSFHYAKVVPRNPVGYSVFNDRKEWCGVIVFSRGATPNIARPYSLRQGEVIELVRVALNGKQEITSKCISIALRLIRRDVPLAKLIVSYADLDQSHTGTIYQATNWIYEGHVQAGKVAAYIVKGKRRHKKSLWPEFKKRKLNQGFAELKMFIDPTAQEVRTKGKHKYLYPLTDDMRVLCEKLKKPYPKSDVPGKAGDVEQTDNVSR